MGGSDQQPEGYHYARGTFRRLAEEEYHQPRQRRLVDYWHRPKGEDVVEAMVEKGWSEDDAREAVRYLWEEQMRLVRERGEQIERSLHTDTDRPNGRER